MASNIKDLKLFGIFGHPLSHTLSPAFQEAGFQKASLRAHYLAFDLSAPAFKRAMRNLKKSPLKGFNITVPYKQTVIPYLDWVTTEARAIGAVNTVYRFGKKWYGTNTDADGFQRAIKEWGFKPRGKHILIIGAGGAARAAAFALAKQGVKSITVWNRARDRRRKLIKDFTALALSSLIPGNVLFFEKTWNAGAPEEFDKYDLIINGTSIGLHPDDPLLIRPEDFPKKKKYFIDLIYNPAETPFLKLARKKGHHTLNGLSMLLYQGARAFEIWTGKKAPVDVMRKALNEALKENPKSKALSTK